MISRVIRIFQSFKGFSSLDFLTLMTSVTAVAVISGPLIKRSLDADQVEKATHEMRRVASEVIAVSNQPKGVFLGGRSPASINPQISVGVVSSDPWGKPYRYKLVKNSFWLIRYSNYF